MFALPDINKLKYKILGISKTGRQNSSLHPKNYDKALNLINNNSYIIPNYPINSRNNRNLYQKNINKHNIKNSSSVFISEKERYTLNKNLGKEMTLINNSTENMKTERETIPDILKYNTKPQNKKSVLTVRADYNDIKNTFSNKPIDINKFVKKINSFLLPDNKTFENIQNLINYKVMINKESSKNDDFFKILKSNELPINTFNYGIIYKYIIKNIIKKTLKRHLIDKALINKKEIKDEYKKQINNLKQYLNLHNKEKSDLGSNQNFESVILNNNNSSPSLISNITNNKVSSNRSSKKMNLERNKRSRKIIQNNSLDYLFSRLDNYDKRFLNSNSKNKELSKKNSLKSLSDKNNNNSFHKEFIENYIQRAMFRRKIDYAREKKLKDIIKKQKNIIDDYIKLKEQTKNNEDNLIKTENSDYENIPGFNFFSNKKSEHINKNEDIINCINNSEKSIKFENSFIKEKIDKYCFKDNKANEKVFNMNSLNSFENKKLLNIEEDLKIRNSLSQRSLFEEKNIISRNLFMNNDKDNNQQMKDSQIFNDDNKPIKRDEEIKKAIDNKKRKTILNKKLFLKKKKTLNVRSFKDFLKEAYYEYKMEELNNKFEEKTIFENDLNTERLMEKNIDEKEEKLLEENLEYQLNNFKNNIKRLKNMSKDEFIKDTLKFIKSSE